MIAVPEMITVPWMRVAIVLGTILSSSPAFCAKLEVPANVTTATGPYRAAYLDTVDFSYQPEQPVEFKRVKLCIAETITNNAVTLQDSSGSFVGATGTYYQNDKNVVVHGGPVFKFVDDNEATLIASGTAGVGASSFWQVDDVLKFDLKIATDAENVTIKFVNITRAQQSTGTIANDGFQPVGVWKGSRFPRIYEALEGVANRIKLCLR